MEESPVPMEDDLFKYKGPILGSDPFLENDRLLVAVSKLKAEVHAPHAFVEVLHRFADLFQALDFASYDDFNGVLVNWLRDRLSAERASLIELDFSTGNFFFRAICDASPSVLLGIQFPSSEGIAGKVLENQAPFVSEKLTDDNHSFKTVEKLTSIEMHNVAAVPLFVAGKFFGVIELLNFSAADSEWFHDQEFWNALSKCIGLFLEVRLLRGALISAPKTENLFLIKKVA